MAAKLFVFLTIAAAARCSVLPLAGSSGDYTRFAYDVADPITGDYKSQVETRAGGIVQGQYSLLESDGTKRVVDYAADALNGFNAVVRKDPIVAPGLIASVAARTIAAPALTAAPVAYSSRIAPSILSPASLAYSSGIVAPSILNAASAYGAGIPSLIGTAPALNAASARLVAGPGLLASTYKSALYGSGIY